VPSTRAWGFEGAAGGIAISGVREHAGRVTAEVAVDIRAAGRFACTCPIGFSAEVLARFHRQLGALLTGGARHATFGDVGDEMALTIDATDDGRLRISGFVAAGMTTAVSFNNLEIDRGSLVRSYLVVDLICREAGVAAVARTSEGASPPAP